MVVGTGSDHCRLQQLQLTGIRVQLSGHTQWEGPLSIDVADGKTIGHGNAQRTEVGGEDLIEPERPVSRGSFKLSESPDSYAGEIAECADQSEVSEHAVYTVQMFAHVLQEEDCTVEVGKVGRPDQAVE